MRKNAVYWTDPDKISGVFEFSRSFEIIINNREEVFDFDSSTADSLVWFTDGAKNSEGVGAGIFCTNSQFEFNFSIAEHATVLQAELLAINKCAELCLEESPTQNKFIIASDSQAALRTLGACKVRSKTVLNCIQNLNKLAVANEVKLVWVPGHSGIAGNEMADQLAKSAAIPSTQAHAVSFIDRIWKQDIKLWQQLKHKQIFSSKEGMKISKAFLSVNDKKAKELLDLSRQDLRLLLGALTGHCRLNKYLHDIGTGRNPGCRLCKDKPETSYHLICECKALAEHRKKFLGSELVDATKIKNTKYTTLLNFLENSGFPE